MNRTPPGNSSGSFCTWHVVLLASSNTSRDALQSHRAERTVLSQIHIVLVTFATRRIRAHTQVDRPAHSTQRLYSFAAGNLTYAASSTIVAGTLSLPQVVFPICPRPATCTAWPVLHKRARRNQRIYTRVLNHLPGAPGLAVALAGGFVYSCCSKSNHPRRRTSRRHRRRPHSYWRVAQHWHIWRPCPVCVDYSSPAHAS